MADFVLNHLPLVGRQPHEAGDFVNEIVDTIFVPQAIPFADRLCSRDALAKGCSEGGFEAFPLGVLSTGAHSRTKRHKQTQEVTALPEKSRKYLLIGIA